MAFFEEGADTCEGVLGVGAIGGGAGTERCALRDVGNKVGFALLLVVRIGNEDKLGGRADVAAIDDVPLVSILLAEFGEAGQPRFVGIAHGTA